MRFARTFVLALLSLLLTLPALPQTLATAAVQRDPQALSVLNQVLNMAGGSQALGTIQDLTATGNITYNWGDNDVRGSATVRSRGTDQFRLDATLPNGVRTIVVSNETAAIRETSGETREIPFFNAINLGSLTYPYAILGSVLKNQTATVQYLGSVTKNGHNAHQVRIQPIPATAEPSGMLHKLSTKDFFIDATTYKILSTLDMVHPDGDFNQEYPREISFSDYRIVNGVLVSFECEERVNGQHTWNIQLTNLSFNTGISDNDFQL